MDDANAVEGLHHLEELDGEVHGHGLDTGLAHLTDFDL